MDRMSKLLLTMIQAGVFQAVVVNVMNRPCGLAYSLVLQGNNVKW